MKTTLNPLAAALSMGVAWAISLFVMTLIGSQTGFLGNFLHILEDVYPWYELSPKGAVIGLVWGFLDGFIGVYVLVWLYNFFVKKLK
ncbi:bacteriophage holin [Candidatus Peregrinibacteria bacterium]|nr:MAG: bacteriophage holin [Candidatus Peregrinibacteria bacterium]